MGAMCDTHPELHLGYQCMNQLILLEELNPLGTVVLNQQDPQVRVYLGAMVVVEVMADQE
jgi:hypothetical protein